MTSWLSSLDRGDRPLEILELFAGQARITRLARQLGIPAEAHDWDYDEEAIGKGGGLNNAMGYRRTFRTSEPSLSNCDVLEWWFHSGQVVVFFSHDKLPVFSKNKWSRSWLVSSPATQGLSFQRFFVASSGASQPSLASFCSSWAWNKPKRSTFTTGRPKCP